MTKTANMTAALWAQYRTDEDAIAYDGHVNAPAKTARDDAEVAELFQHYRAWDDAITPVPAEDAPTTDGIQVAEYRNHRAAIRALERAGDTDAALALRSWLSYQDLKAGGWCA